MGLKETALWIALWLHSHHNKTTAYQTQKEPTTDALHEVRSLFNRFCIKTGHGDMRHAVMENEPKFCQLFGFTTFQELSTQLQSDLLAYAVPLFRKKEYGGIARADRPSWLSWLTLNDTFLQYANEYAELDNYNKELKGIFTYGNYGEWLGPVSGNDTLTHKRFLHLNLSFVPAAVPTLVSRDVSGLSPEEQATLRTKLPLAYEGRLSYPIRIDKFASLSYIQDALANKGVGAMDEYTAWDLQNSKLPSPKTWEQMYGNLAGWKGKKPIYRACLLWFQCRAALSRWSAHASETNLNNETAHPKIRGNTALEADCFQESPKTMEAEFRQVWETVQKDDKLYSDKAWRDYLAYAVGEEDAKRAGTPADFLRILYPKSLANYTRKFGKPIVNRTRKMFQGLRKAFAKKVAPAP